jgi:hypothetical protein
VESRRGIRYTSLRNEIQAQLVFDMCASLPHLRSIQLSNLPFDISDDFISNIIHTIPNFSSFSCGDTRLMTLCMIKEWIQYQMEFSSDLDISKMTPDQLENLKNSNRCDFLERKSCRELYLEKFIQYKELGYLTLLLRYKISFDVVKSPVHKLFVRLSWCKETVPVFWWEVWDFRKDLHIMISRDLRMESGIYYTELIVLAANDCS